ncbi:hypothetical protein [Candidatus Nitrosocosmicus sp. R]
MNNTDVLEIIQKRTTQFTVISVVFVIVVIFLVPALVEEADTIISAKATSTAGPFSNVWGTWKRDYGLLNLN